jgi:hypothetical protein
MWSIQWGPHFPGGGGATFLLQPDGVRLAHDAAALHGLGERRITHEAFALLA